MTDKEFIEQMSSGEEITNWSDVHLHMHGLSARAQMITHSINDSYHTQEELRELMSKLVGYEMPKVFGLFPPFYTDCGINIKIGNEVFINSGCCFQDQGGITIGEGTFIGHQVVIATLNHDINPYKRANMKAYPVTIGPRVWIGSKSMILPGVTIGENSIIGAGSVVTKDIPANVIAAGNPCRVIKPIPQFDPLEKAPSKEEASRD